MTRYKIINSLNKVKELTELSLTKIFLNNFDDYSVILHVM